MGSGMSLLALFAAELDPMVRQEGARDGDSLPSSSTPSFMGSYSQAVRMFLHSLGSLEVLWLRSKF